MHNFYRYFQIIFDNLLTKFRIDKENMFEIEELCITYAAMHKFCACLFSIQAHVQ